MLVSVAQVQRRAEPKPLLTRLGRAAATRNRLNVAVCPYVRSPKEPPKQAKSAALTNISRKTTLLGGCLLSHIDTLPIANKDEHMGHVGISHAKCTLDQL